MNAPPSATALRDANQQALAAYVAALRTALSRREPGASDPGLPDPRLTIPALGMIASLFGLSRFEAETLVLAAAPELDGAICALCAAANGDAARPWPNFGLALALLSEPHWSALLPDAPLRRWRLVDVDTDAGLACGRLRAAEAVLHRLAGLGGLDQRLAGWVRLLPANGTVPASHAQAAEIGRVALACGARGTPNSSAVATERPGPGHAARRSSRDLRPRRPSPAGRLAVGFADATGGAHADAASAGTRRAHGRGGAAGAG